MSLGLIVYLISLADGLKGLFIIGAVILFFICIVLTIVSTLEGGGYGCSKTVEDYMRTFKLKGLAVSFALCSVLAVVIPSKETSYVIVAATGADILADSEGVQRIAGKSMAVVEKQLDMYLNEGKEKEGETTVEE